MTQDEAHGARAAALFAAVLLGLLALAERAGLPPDWTRGFLGAIAALAAGSVLTLARTSRERPFLGLDPVLGPLSGALALVAAIWTIGNAAAPAIDPGSWLASLLGGCFGLVAAHIVVRLALRRERSGMARPSDRLAPYLAFVQLVSAGAAVLVAARVGASEATRVLGLENAAALSLALGLPLAAVLLGGARGALSLAATTAAAAVIGMAALIAAGVAALGPVPLPGQSEAGTLQAIADARRLWSIAAPAHLTDWPNVGSILEGDGPAAFGLSFAIAVAIAIAGAPAAPIHRKSMAATAVAALALLPFVVTAIAGYAVEAAATQFIGAAIAQPPAALIEAARMGLVSICGSFPETADAMKAACGVGPRDPSMIAWSQLAPAPAFLDSGLAVALGFPPSISVALGGMKLALALAATAFGLWIAARAMGRDILGRRRRAPGLASLRLGLTRLSAALLASGAGAALISQSALGSHAVWATCFGGAAVILLADASWRALRPSTQPADDTAKPQQPVRRRPKAADRSLEAAPSPPVDAERA